ncbi:MAG TPA: hypothetical protein V6D17_17385 [Candidatus Obscuribacterales bacterium]
MIDEFGADRQAAEPAGKAVDEATKASSQEASGGPKRNASDLRKLLRAKMSRVLETSHQLIQLQGAKDRSRANVQQAYAECKAVILPASEDEARVKDFLLTAEERQSHYMRALEADNEADRALSLAQYDWQTARLELRAAIQEASSHELLKEDEVLAAANYMSSWQALVPRDLMAQPQVATQEVPVLTDEQLATIEKLRQATFKAAMQVARALKEGPTIVAAATEVSDSNWISVKPPVRPTEEEVQRYLRQAEAATVRRMNAHKQLLSLVPLRAAILKDLNAAKEILNAAVAGASPFARTPRRPECTPAFEVALVVLSLCATAENAMGSEPDTRWLDKADRAAVTSREKRQIEELRKLMRQLAIARATLNESATTLIVAKVHKDVEFKLSGIARASNWQECLAWHAEQQKRKESIAQNNLAQRTKIELLAELVKQHERDHSEAATALYRYIVAIMPAKERPPANELRALMNAAAWMCKPNPRDDEPRREGDYPIY